MEEAAQLVDAQNAKTAALLRVRKARSARDVTKAALQQKQGENMITNRYGVGYDAASDSQISGLKQQLDTQQAEVDSAQAACNAVACEDVKETQDVVVVERPDGTITYNDDSLPWWVYIMIALFVIGIVLGLLWWFLIRRPAANSLANIDYRVGAEPNLIAETPSLAPPPTLTEDKTAVPTTTELTTTIPTLTTNLPVFAPTLTPTLSNTTPVVPPLAPTLPPPSSTPPTLSAQAGPISNAPPTSTLQPPTLSEPSRPMSNAPPTLSAPSVPISNAPPTFSTRDAAAPTMTSSYRAISAPTEVVPGTVTQIAPTPISPAI